METKKHSLPEKVETTFSAFSFKLAILLLIVSVVNLTTGCYYYKVKTSAKISAGQIKQYSDKKKYLILDKGKSSRQFVPDSVYGDTVSGSLLPVSEDHLRLAEVRKNKNQRYEKADKPLLSEVHLCLPDSNKSIDFSSSKVNLQASLINKIEVYKKAKGRATASWLVPVVLSAGVIGGIVTIAAIAASSSSCPFVYVKSGPGYTFSGEIFGGAIYSSLERHDYLPLPDFLPESDQYRIKISNLLQEVQYINLAELWVVDHPVGVTVLPGHNGAIHTLAAPQLPLSARSSSGNDVRPLIGASDGKKFLFDEPPLATSDSCAFNRVEMTFALPVNSNNGKLVVRAGNSYWGDYAVGGFTKLIGNKYMAWIKKQGRAPAAPNIQWTIDQGLVMNVFIESGRGWKFVDYFEMTGPFGPRDMVMPLDFTDAMITTEPDGQRSVRVRIESGFKLWELDYAAMDYTADTNFTINVVKPSSAISETGKDILSLVNSDDHRYYTQYHPGEEGWLSFPDIESHQDGCRSLILHSKGYYNHVRDYPDPPDRKKLAAFARPGTFSRFSYDMWTDMNNNKSQLLTQESHENR